MIKREVQIGDCRLLLGDCTEQPKQLKQQSFLEDGQ